MRIALIASFRQLTDASVPFVGDVLLHIPRYWDASAEERVLVSKLAESPPKRSGLVLMYSADVEMPTGHGSREHFIDVLTELENRASGRSLLLRDAANTAVDCVAAYCGEYEQVVSRVASATQNHAEVSERQAALSGLTSHPDPDVVTFALLAQNAPTVGGQPDWRAIETQYIMCTDGVLPAEKVLSVLCSHSPGATSRLRQRQLAQEISSVRPVFIENSGLQQPAVGGLNL